MFRGGGEEAGGGKRESSADAERGGRGAYVCSCCYRAAVDERLVKRREVEEEGEARVLRERVGVGSVYQVIDGGTRKGAAGVVSELW